MTIGEFVERYSVCDGGSAAAKGESHRDLKEAWDNVDKASWLFWMLSRARVDQKKLVKAACAVARETLPLLPAGEKRPLAAIEAAEGWVNGTVEKSKVLDAGKASLQCSEELDPHSAAHIAAFVGFEAANSVKTALRTPGIAIATGAALVAAGKGTAEENDVALTPILRKYITWADAEAALQAFKPQPKEDYELSLPGTVSDEVVSASAEKQAKLVEELLGQAEEIKQRYKSVLQENGLDEKIIAQVKNATSLGADGSALVSEIAAALDQPDVPASAPKVSKRPRTMI